MNRPAHIELACMFPAPLMGQGAATRLSDIPRHHPDKQNAAKLCLRRNMELGGIAYGNGNKAAKKAALIEMYREQPDLPLSEHDINRMATIDEEMRTEGRNYKLIPA